MLCVQQYHPKEHIKHLHLGQNQDKTSFHSLKSFGIFWGGSSGSYSTSISVSEIHPDSALDKTVNNSGDRAWNHLLHKQHFTLSRVDFTPRVWYSWTCQILRDDSGWPWRIHILQPINHLSHSLEWSVRSVLSPCHLLFIRCLLSQALNLTNSSGKPACFGIDAFIYLPISSCHMTASKERQPSSRIKSLRVVTPRNVCFMVPRSGWRFLQKSIWGTAAPYESYPSKKVACGCVVSIRLEYNWIFIESLSSATVHRHITSLITMQSGFSLKHCTFVGYFITLT